MVKAMSVCTPRNAPPGQIRHTVAHYQGFLRVNLRFIGNVRYLRAGERSGRLSRWAFVRILGIGRFRLSMQLSHLNESISLANGFFLPQIHSDYNPTRFDDSKKWIIPRSRRNRKYFHKRFGTTSSSFHQRWLTVLASLAGKRSSLPVLKHFRDGLKYTGTIFSASASFAIYHSFTLAAQPTSR